MGATEAALGTLDLVFRKDAHGRSKPLRENISAMAIAGRTLFCGCDEGNTVERLVFDEATGTFELHSTLDLGEAFDLPDKRQDSEIDIEGLALADGFLWITGSHGLKRDKAKGEEDAIEALSDVDWDANRALLGRVPVVDLGHGLFEPVGRVETLDGGDGRRAAAIEMGKKGRRVIRDMLGREPLIKPFMGVPAKENGFDIEGIAVAGERVFLGLRGPVIGGRALLVEMRLKTTKAGFLKPGKIDGKRRYRLHTLDLGGLGIRDLLFDAEGRLLILAGVTMALTGPQAVFVLEKVPKTGGAIDKAKLRRALELPIVPFCDHAEGMAVFGEGDGRRLAVVYDCPAPARLDGRRNSLRIDLFAPP